MALKKAILILAGIVLACLFSPNITRAQWGIGGSYEIRDREPENGFGVRLERGILQKFPILGLRAHFSYFSDENQVDPQDPNQSTFSQEITDYDIGVTALAGVNIGLLKPYVGIGLGSNTINLDVSNDAPDGFSDNEESKIYWNALIGAELSPLPVLKPFVEYRYSDVGEDFFKNAQSQNVRESYNGRIIFGVLLSF